MLQCTQIPSRKGTQVRRPIVYIDTSTIREGKLEELEEAMKHLAAFVEANMPQLISYGFFLDQDSTQMNPPLRAGAGIGLRGGRRSPDRPGRVAIAARWPARTTPYGARRSQPTSERLAHRFMARPRTPRRRRRDRVSRRAESHPSPSGSVRRRPFGRPVASSSVLARTGAGSRSTAWRISQRWSALSFR